MARTLGTHHPVDPTDIDVEYLLVEEEQGAEGLVLGGSRDLSLGSEKGEESYHLLLPHLFRMTQTRKADEEANPISVGLLGTVAVVERLDPFTHLL